MNNDRNRFYAISGFGLHLKFVFIFEVGAKPKVSTYLARNSIKPGNIIGIINNKECIR